MPFLHFDGVSSFIKSTTVEILISLVEPPEGINKVPACLCVTLDCKSFDAASAGAVKEK